MNVKDKLYQTTAGRSRLLDELGELQKMEIALQHRRAEHRQNIGNNHADGDECRNLDNDLSSCIARMKHINDVISESTGIAPAPTSTSVVELESVVTVLKFANKKDTTGTSFTFQVVGHGESAPNGSGMGELPGLPLISYTCPQGAAVMKQSVGDEVTVNRQDQEIVKIELPSQLKATNAA